MATVNFLFRSTKENAPLNLRLLFRHNDKDHVLGTKTNFEVSKTHWHNYHVPDKITKKIKGSKNLEISNRQQEVNTELNKIENHILKAFDEADINEVTKDWLKLQVDLFYNPPKKNAEIPTNLIDYIDFYIEYRKHEIKPTSTKKYNVIKSKLDRMQTERKRPILIQDINDNFKNEFVAYQKSKGYAQNTIQRELVFVKTFCKHARFLGLETDPQLDSLRVDKAKAEKIYLTFDELEAIEKQGFEHDYLDNARDWLIISCYTGQRVSDFLRFTKDMVRIENGKSLLEFRQTKTNKLMTLPIHKKVMQILKKRNGNFPRSISDQKYNDYIKEVCKITGLNDTPSLTELIQGSKLVETENGYRKVSAKYEKFDLVTSHIGRRSLASNFYGTIPTTYLIYITGHSTEVSFLNYIGKSNKDLAMEISNYFN
ncbi:tyrosine-type recombinase/integrase [Gelidibacter salicanalis]|uniref:Tyrosine-type recombinase/integrase n=1 Tax=Gelidibacter salicanalis TaxID=291193 RepID=A0A5C7APB9_9FLAO|nr:phage integrase SAM-like domain-containing protein [Gelidibacter salicanalis]TXE10498.1 tyrosine-type recombinase/integrase [Gelidibacter salicanalis]